MKRGSQIGLAVSALLLMAAGVTNLCSAVAHEATAKPASGGSTGHVPTPMSPAAESQEARQQRQNRYAALPPRFHRLKDDDREAGDFAVFRTRIPELVPAVYSPVSKAPGVRSNDGPRVTLIAENAPTRVVFEQLFQQAKVPYSIDPGVSGRLTLHITATPFKKAFHQVLYHAIPMVFFRQINGVYVIQSVSDVASTD